MCMCVCMCMYLWCVFLCVYEAFYCSVTTGNDDVFRSYLRKRESERERKRVKEWEGKRYISTSWTKQLTKCPRLHLSSLKADFRLYKCYIPSVLEWLSFYNRSLLKFINYYTNNMIVPFKLICFAFERGRRSLFDKFLIMS